MYWWLGGEVVVSRGGANSNLSDDSVVESWVWKNGLVDRYLHSSAVVPLPKEDEWTKSLGFFERNTQLALRNQIPFIKLSIYIFKYVNLNF